MKTTRREFLGGAIALTGALAVPGVALASIPKLYGDGVHDDAPALNALLAGEPVDADGAIAIREGGSVHLKNGATYAIGSTLVVGSNRNLYGNGATLLCLPGHTGSSIQITGSNVKICDIHSISYSPWYSALGSEPYYIKPTMMGGKATNKRESAK
jgi:hypothetical protein